MVAMPARDSEANDPALYLLVREVGEVKGQLVLILEQQTEFRKALSVINVAIAAQSGATSVLHSEVKSLREAMTGLDVRVASLIATRDQGHGVMNAIKFGWAVLATVGTMIGGFVGWLLGQQHKPW